ncbi:hypothetical protein Tco_0680474 [Tanacetum coccineum]|uniref:Uncharacterized protein n=1 Tax=Tanacetum coccineum TaxID=301880 RepID=A0ABQ4XKL6_9ASTR
MRSIAIDYEIFVSFRRSLECLLHEPPVDDSPTSGRSSSKHSTLEVDRTNHKLSGADNGSSPSAYLIPGESSLIPSSSRCFTILGYVTKLLAISALYSVRSIMVKLALVAQRHLMPFVLLARASIVVTFPLPLVASILQDIGNDLKWTLKNKIQSNVLTKD